MRRRLVVVACLLGGVLVNAGPSAAATITPTTFADEFNGAAPCSLREAIRSAVLDTSVGGCPAGSGADTIQLQAGTYQLGIGGPPEDLGVAGDLDVSTPVNIVGAGAHLTVIDGGAVDRVFHVGVPASGPPTLVPLAGVTVRNGMASDTGGILVDAGTTATISDSAVVDNQTPGGAGGIRNEGTLTIVRSIVARNISVDAVGGVGNQDQGLLTVTDSAIVDNRVDGEGAGGGIANFGEGQATLTNVTVSGNDVLGNGGGLVVSTDPGGFVHMTNVTISNNRAGNPTGTDAAAGGIKALGEVEVTNSIVAGNLDRSTTTPAPDCDGDVTSLGDSIIGDDTECTISSSSGDLIGTGASPIDAKLGALGDNGGLTPTQALLDGSPALDSAGTDCPAADQRGAPRTGACDRGAYEVTFCLGTVVNRVGTAGDDVLVGTAGPDGFLAFDGADRVRGLGGADRACMGPGKDVAAGGPGNDRLLGEQGKDTLRGGPGRDRLVGGPGKDTCVGGPKRDKARACETEKGIP